MIICLLHFILIYVGFWLQVGGSQGSPWRPISSPFGVLSCSWGQDGPKTPQEALQDRFLSPTYPSKTDFWGQHGPRIPSKRVSGSIFWRFCRWWNITVKMKGIQRSQVGGKHAFIVHRYYVSDVTVIWYLRILLSVWRHTRNLQPTPTL